MATASMHKIALVGATGNLGPVMLKGLLDGGLDVTILSRQGSTSTDSIATHPRQKITKVNFEDVNSISSALEDIEGVVINLASSAILSQKTIIDAAIAAGVKRFLPSDFGADLSLAINRTVPMNAPKIEIHHYLEEKSKQHPEFSYTIVANGPLFDWSLDKGLYGNLKTHEMTLWDGGETKVSTTTRASIARAVVGIFKNPEATKNKEICIADTTITQKEIMEIAKEIDGKEWTTKQGSTAESWQSALDELAKPNPNAHAAVISQLFRVMFDTELGPCFEDKLDNDKVGLPIMTREQVKEVIKNSMA